MEGREYCREVLAHIPRATRREKEAIRRELADHLADGAEAWKAAGCGPEEARARAVEAMGDPAETGRALNAQLSPFWLWLGRGSLLLAAGFCLLLAMNFLRVQAAVENLTARVAPTLLVRRLEKDLPEGYTYAQTVDLRLDMGQEELRVCRVYMDPSSPCRVGLGLVWYSRDLHGCAPLRSWPEVCSPNGGIGKEGSNYVPYGVLTCTYLQVPVEPGDTYVTLRCERYGREWELRVPLPWEVRA